jgi:hypothetical protein
MNTSKIKAVVFTAVITLCVLLAGTEQSKAAPYYDNYDSYYQYYANLYSQTGNTTYLYGYAYPYLYYYYAGYYSDYYGYNVDAVGSKSSNYLGSTPDSVYYLNLYDYYGDYYYRTY